MTKKTEVVKKEVPKTRDFLRVCDCGIRIVCQIKNHGYINILTVEVNGYLFQVGYQYLQLKNRFNRRKLVQNANDFTYNNADLVFKQTGINREQINDYFASNKIYKKAISDGIFKKLTKSEIKDAREEVAQLGRTVPIVSYIPIYLIRSLNPNKVTYIKCSRCHKKMMFKTFKEIKHGAN